MTRVEIPRYVWCLSRLGWSRPYAADANRREVRSKDRRGWLQTPFFSLRPISWRMYRFFSPYVFVVGSNILFFADELGEIGDHFSMDLRCYWLNTWGRNSDGWGLVATEKLAYRGLAWKNPQPQAEQNGMHKLHFKQLAIQERKEFLGIKLTPKKCTKKHREVEKPRLFPAGRFHLSKYHSELGRRNVGQMCI